MLEDCLALVDNPFLKEAKVEREKTRGLKQIPASQMDPGAPGGDFTAYQEIPASVVNHRVLRPEQLKVRAQEECLRYGEPGMMAAPPLPLFSQEVPTGGVVEEEYLPTPDVVTEK
jgi:hypothetical protein